MTGQINVNKIAARTGNTITVESGDVLQAPGHVLQVVSTTKTDTQSITGSSFVDISGLSATITPSSTSSKIFVSVDVSFSGDQNAYVAFQILRGSTEILKATETGTGIECAGGQVINNSGNEQFSVHKESMSGLDSPNTTSETTYKVQISPMRTSSKTAFVNRSYSLGDDNQFRSASTITLMEIAG